MHNKSNIDWAQFWFLSANQSHIQQSSVASTSRFPNNMTSKTYIRHMWYARREELHDIVVELVGWPNEWLELYNSSPPKASQANAKNETNGLPS